MEKIDKKLAKLQKKGKYEKYRKLAFEAGKYYNVDSYAGEFKHTFGEVPFTDADSLVLCQFAYANLMDFIGKPLREVYDLIEDKDNVCPCYQEDSLKLIESMKESVRFGDIVILDVRESYIPEEVCQFGITLFDCGDFIYLACRGTDHHLVGWIEDIDLILKEEIPSHVLAKAALNEYGAQYDKPIIVGGHSKGGNVAIECAAFCDETVQNKIIRIYDHDGPGLQPQVMEREGMVRMLDKIDKTVPELAIFGMILHQGIPYRSIYSHDGGVWQHYIFNWQIEKESGTLVKTEGTNRPSRVVRTVIEDVLPTMTTENRAEFRAFVVNITAGVDTMDDFSAGMIFKMIGRMFKQPWSRQKYMWKLLGQVIVAVFVAEKKVHKERKLEKENKKESE